MARFASATRADLGRIEAATIDEAAVALALRLVKKDYDKYSRCRRVSVSVRMRSGVVAYDVTIDHPHSTTTARLSVRPV